ncbi:SPRY domain-containing protein, partial [Aphelenchoides avenae]
MHDSVRQLGRRGASQMMQPEVVEKPPAVEEPPVDVAGPKTRGASRRRQVEPAAGGGSGAGSGMKKAKTASDFTSLTLEGMNGTVDIPFNREGYRYYLTERDKNIPNGEVFDLEEISTSRTIPGHAYRVVHNPTVTISPNDRAHQLRVADDQLTVTGFEGYSVARATHSVAHGKWYFEVEFLHQPKESAMRIGWGQALAVVQACLGYTKFSYSWRSLKGTAFHEAKGHHYDDGGYGQGDTLGCLIDLPALGEHDAEQFTFSDFLPPSCKDMTLVKFKNNYFYEEIEDVQKAARLAKPLHGSRIEFFKNGASCGTAFSDIFAGFYFPAVSIYQDATVRCNFGPKFKHRPPPGARGICERPEEVQ